MTLPLTLVKTRKPRKAETRPRRMVTEVCPTCEGRKGLPDPHRAQRVDPKIAGYPTSDYAVRLWLSPTQGCSTCMGEGVVVRQVKWGEKE